jgi:hypothetical protein
VERLAWFFANADLLRLTSPMLRTLVVGLLLYNTDYVWLFLRAFWARIFPEREAPFVAPHALVVLPTLLGKQEDASALLSAIESVMHSGYPGPLHVVAAIDGRGERLSLYAALEARVEALRPPPGVTVLVTGCDTRQGKAMAMEHAIDLVREHVESGELAEFPPVFFNLDADSELGPRALELMVRRLYRPNLIGRLPMAVASNVGVRRSHYYRGFRHMFSVGGQLSLQVAREYTQSIGVGKSNTRLVPVTGLSGALYCTWSFFHLEGPRYSAYLRSLTLGDWLRWWLGVAPPSYAASRVTPLPEAMTGPGDDTYLTWLAMMGSWRRGALSLELPRSPLHALGRLCVDWVFRPLAYDARASIHTSSPTTVRGLFKQRVRWNGSRAFTIRGHFSGLAFHLNVAVPVFLDMALLLVSHGAVVVGLIAWPFLPASETPASAVLLAVLVTLLLRATGTLLGLVMNGGREHLPQLYALPLTIPYHFVFNILTTIVALWQDFFGFGCNTGFAPESTLIKTRTSRLALAYRLRRAAWLAARALTHGDVPFGAFWFGFGETAFTPCGYEGWTSGRAVGALKPRASSRPSLEPATLEPARQSHA